MTILRAALTYALLVFAAGFALGVVRTLVLAPSLGATAAVALELPVILAVSWIAAGFVLRKARRPLGLGARAATGALAFAMLMGLEAALGFGVMGLSVAGYFAKYATLAGALGLLGQIAFAVLPSLRRSSV